MIPRTADIVIYQRPASGGRCIVSAFQQASQLSVHTYDDAVRHATTLAAQARVDAWYTADGQTYRRIVAHRATTGSPARCAA